MRLSRRELLKAAGVAMISSGISLGTRSIWGASGGSHSYALHIGVDNFDQRVYPRTKFLAGCKIDADAMYKITSTKATSGFTRSKKLLDGEATFENVAKWIHWAAIDLQPGSTFLISYSGHGSQLTSRPEPQQPGKDSTWCLYNEQMRDDYLYWLWSHFRAGVKIVLISDSCHSGTIARAVEAVDNDLARSGGVLRSLVDQNLTLPDGATRSRARSAADTEGGDGFPDVTRVRMLNPTQQEEAEQQRFRTFGADVSNVRSVPGRFSLRNEIGDFSGENVVVASGLQIAACQDYEAAQESVQNPGGLFTKAISRAIGGSIGSYRQLYEQTVKHLKGVQSPKWFPFGNEKDDPSNGININNFYDGTKPFTVMPPVQS